jgi:copper(I)-binding protein
LKRTISLLIFILILTLAVGCASISLTVKDTWARPGNAGGVGAVYFIIENPADVDDLLLSADCDAAEYVELHQSTMNNEGIMSMQQQETVPVPGRSIVEFKPGGLHIMLINLEKDLNPGGTLTLNLNFQNAGKIQLEATVREQ